MDSIVIISLALIGAVAAVVITVAGVVGFFYIQVYKQTQLNYRKEIEYRKALAMSGGQQSEAGGGGFDVMSLMGLLQNPAVLQGLKGLMQQQQPAQPAQGPSSTDVI